jgi:hypothetical protein
MILISVSVMLGACAHLKGGASAGSEEALRQRVLMEWDAKVNKDWEVVYELAVDEYKKKVSRSGFLQGCNLDVREFSIKEIEILESGKKAVATVECKTYNMGMPFQFTFKEKWLLENEGWHLELMPLGLPGTVK